MVLIFFDEAEDETQEDDDVTDEDEIEKDGSAERRIET